MQVIATNTGWDGQAIRNKDDVFEMPEGSKGSWFVPLEVVQKAAKARNAKKAAEGEGEGGDLA